MLTGEVSQLKNALERKFLNSKNIVILTHESPTIDHIASSLAMFWYFVNLDEHNNVDIIIPSYSREYDWLPGFEKIKAKPNGTKNYDVAIIIGASTLSEIGSVELLERCDSKFCINNREGYIFDYPTIIDTEVTTCSKILNSLFENKRLEFSQCIAAGIFSAK